MQREDPGKAERAAAGLPVVPAFDGYRAFAIAGVVVLHVLVFSGVLQRAEGTPAFAFVQGTLGQMIDVLFVVSGFVVFLPTVARGGDFGSVAAYASRRAARLGPAYWLALLLLLVAIAVVPPAAAPPAPDPADVLVHVTFLQTPAQLVGGVPLGFGIDGPVWTLSLEVTFYLLLPLVAGWYARRPLVGLAIAAVLTAAWHEAIPRLGELLPALGADVSPGRTLELAAASLIQFPFFLFSFAAGMTGAWAYVRLSAQRPAAALARRAGWAQLAALALLAGFAALVGSRAEGVLLGAEVGRRPALLGLGFSASLAAFLVATALASAGRQRLFTLPTVRWFADRSYGVYLVHVPLLVWAVAILGLDEGHAGLTAAAGALTRTGDGGVADLALLAVAVVPLAALYGVASARWVEQPVRRWVRRGVGRPSARRRAPARP